MPANRLRRKYLARLLAQIDQEIAEIESLAGDLRRSNEERRIAVAQMENRRTAVMRVEWMLANTV